MTPFLRDLIVGIVIIVGLVILNAFIALPGWLIPVVAIGIGIYLVIVYGLNSLR